MPNSVKFQFESTSAKLLLSTALLACCLQVSAGEANVLKVEPSCTEKLVCSFAVTVEHADSGWDHYADKWDVLLTDGTLVASRKLRHPHANEQPFTRSLQNVQLPQGTKAVEIRAHDSVHGYGGQTVTVRIP